MGNPDAAHLLAALQAALEALEVANPKMAHYAEARQRHERAIATVRAAIAKATGGTA